MPYNPELRAAVVQAVRDALPLVADEIAKGGYLRTHYRFPERSSFDNGQPHFTHGTSKEPIDYGAVAGSRAESLPSWKEFQETVERIPEVRRHFRLNPEHITSEAQLKTLRFSLRFQLHGIIDHYVHTFGSPAFDEGHFDRIYDLWEASIYSQHLALAIVVPLLMLTSPVNAIELSPGASIERMSESLQLARAVGLESHTVAINETVLGAATHALVLRGWTIENSDLYTRWQTLSQRGTFAKVVGHIDSFFDAFRLVSDVETGYGQIVIVPEGWADSWHAHLPNVSVQHVREYPEHFENFGWLTAPNVVAEDTFRQIGRASVFLTKNKTLPLATRRLSLASLRRNATDAIVDALIGLESLLLSDDDRSEITFKFSLRLAGLCRIVAPFNGLTPVQMTSLCKKLYKVRSDLVHGRTDEPKDVVVDGTVFQPVQTTLALLRHVLRAMMERNEFLQPSRIDEALLKSADSTPTSAALRAGDQPA